VLSEFGQGKVARQPRSMLAVVKSRLRTMRAFPFSRLGLSTGSAPLRLNVPGADLRIPPISLSSTGAASLEFPPTRRMPHRGGQRFESPQLHHYHREQKAKFPASTIPRLFSALARKLMVCGVDSAGTLGLGPAIAEMSLRRRILGSRLRAGLISEIANLSEAISVRRAPLESIREHHV
jgi:hypothetical protein